MQFIDDKKHGNLLKPFLYIFFYLSVNSLLSKIDELRDITNYIRPAILGITESKLDSSVTNAEVYINGYSIIRYDRNRNDGGDACYIRNDLCFNIKNIFSNSLNMFFSKFSYQKLNLLQSEYFTDPQMQMIFKIYFQAISSKLTAKPMKLIFSETLISTYFKMENLSSKKISNIKFQFCLSKQIQRILPNIFIG